MAIGSVSVEVVPDARGFHKKLQAELRDLKANVKVGVDLDDKRAKTQIAALGKNQKLKLGVDLNDAGAKTRLRDMLRGRTVVVQANVKDQAAKAKLDALAARERRLDIKANLDAKVAQARLDKLTRPRTVDVKAKSSGVTEATQGLVSLMDVAIAVAPALIPATAAIAGLAGALAAPLATAGAGGGIFAVLSVAAIAKATKDAKAVEQSQKKVTSLQAMSQKYADKAADASGKQATSYRKQAEAYDKQAKAQQKATDQMLAGLPAGEQRFIKASHTISKGFDTLLRRSHVFEPLTAGALLLGKVLPRLAPITDAFGTAITGVVNQLSKFSDSHGFRSAVNFVAHDGVRAFTQFSHIATNVAVGVGGLIKAFSPLGTTVLSTIGRATAAFRDFGKAAGSGKSAGFQSFLDYVHRVGPSVGTTLVDIGKAVGRVVLALAPQGSTVLGVIDVLAKTVAKMKPSQIAAVATAVGALGIATGKFSGLKGLSLLVAGLSYAYNHSNAFRTLANDAGKLAGALNNLPDIAKVIGGASLLAGGIALRGGKGGGSAVGGAVSKALGGGVQKVFVTNPGFGKPGSGAPGSEPASKVGGAALSLGSKAGIAGIVAATIGYISLKGTQFNLGGSVSKPKGALSGGKFGDAARNFNLGLPSVSLKGSAGGGGLGNFARSLDLSRLGKFTAGVFTLKSGFAMASKESGSFGKSLAGAVGGAANTAFRALRSGALSMQEFRRNAEKAGVSSAQFGKMLHSLPARVQTEIKTPGSLKAKSDVKALAKQYGLTPKQVKTITQLVGYRDAHQKSSELTKTLKALNHTSAKPHIQPQGAEVADKKIAKNRAGLRQLNTTNAKPHVQAQGTGDLDKKVARNQSAMRKLNASQAKPRVDVQGTAGAVTKIHSVSGALNGVPHNIPVSINIHAYGAAAAIAQAHAAANAARQAAGNATGGWIRGPGTGTSDSIPRWLSNGEFVVNAASAARNASLLEAINGGRNTARNSMATGGTVSNRAPAVAASSGGLHIEYSGNVYASDPDALARKQAARDRVAIAAMVRG